MSTTVSIANALTVARAARPCAVAGRTLFHPPSSILLSLLLLCAAAAPAPTPARTPARPAGPTPRPGLLAAALTGPLKDLRHIVFATRSPGHDPHWYANFGYWSEDENKPMYGAPGGRLCHLDLRTRAVKILLDDPRGSVRDCTVHYDGAKVLFSYRKGDSRYYNLFEVNADGTGLRQLTDGPWDDIEPCYLPSGEIAFCSSRSKRWVSCWFTHVATLHRCDKDGKNLRLISANIEHDNTPAVMPDGRLLYTRWEYVDRSQVDYHHLWTSNPDGTRVAPWFGNMHRGTVMIDARPVPGAAPLVAAIFSPGHGRNEHVGDLRLVNPEAGPDATAAAVPVPGAPRDVRDPVPLGGPFYLAARKAQLLFIDSAAGAYEVIHTTDRGELHEPAPLAPRPREPIVPDASDPTQATGRLVLADVYTGRNMAGVRPGEITKLLVVEALPKPVNFSGGPEPVSWLGTFNLERVLGTVPVEPDGSAHLELPANRAFILVALDDRDRSVKRMQSFVSVMPGETTSCVGCHEQRTQTARPSANLIALRRPASKVEPFADIPDVLDFPRDIQPILDAHCAKCHNYDKPDGGIVLSADRGPIYSHAYWMLLASRQVADGRNALGNNPPRTIGTGASPLMDKLDGAHYGAKLDARQRRTIWMWIESGAPYAGTYASLGNGSVGVHMFPPSKKDQPFQPSAATKVIERRCYTCHAAPIDFKVPAGKVVLPAAVDRFNQPGRAPHERILTADDPVIRRSRETLFNMTRPEKSIVLLAPLAKSAGGWGVCQAKSPAGTPEVFTATDDPDYKLLLDPIARTKARLDEIKRFDMPGFRPRAQYVREMKRFGILPPTFDPARDALDPYATDQAYWRSLWWTPTRKP